MTIYDQIEKRLYKETYVEATANDDGLVWVTLQSYVGLTPAQCRDFATVLLVEAAKVDAKAEGVAR